MRSSHYMDTAVWLGQRSRKESTIRKVPKELCYLIFLGGRKQGSHDGSVLQLIDVHKKLLSADQNTKLLFEAWTRDHFIMN